MLPLKNGFIAARELHSKTKKIKLKIRYKTRQVAIESFALHGSCSDSRICKVATLEYTKKFHLRGYNGFKIQQQWFCGLNI